MSPYSCTVQCSAVMGHNAGHGVEFVRMSHDEVLKIGCTADHEQASQAAIGASHEESDPRAGCCT